MSKKQRKPRPEPPKWFWLETDNCWNCKNKNNCNGCKILKQLSTQLKKRKRRIDFLKKI
jgi:hypothetical protein